MLSRHLVLAGMWVVQILFHMACVCGILLPCWAFYHKAVSVLADNLEGGRIKSCAEFVSLALLD